MKIRPINQALVGIALVAVALHFRPGVLPGIPGVSKHVVIVEESGERTAKQAMAYVGLQHGAELKRRTAKGCVLSIIDRDDVNQLEQAAVSKADFEGTQLPAILFYAKRNGKLLYKQSLGKEFTAEQVTSICKRHGA